jgi:hypothetical protein
VPRLGLAVVANVTDRAVATVASGGQRTAWTEAGW